jgi:hypothetical protein
VLAVLALPLGSRGSSIVDSDGGSLNASIRDGGRLSSSAVECPSLFDEAARLGLARLSTRRSDLAELHGSVPPLSLPSINLNVFRAEGAEPGSHGCAEAEGADRSPSQSCSHQFLAVPATLGSNERESDVASAPSSSDAHSRGRVVESSDARSAGDVALDGCGPDRISGSLIFGDDAGSNVSRLVTDASSTVVLGFCGLLLMMTSRLRLLCRLDPASRPQSPAPEFTKPPTALRTLAARHPVC